MTARRWSDLSKPERRRELMRSGIQVVIVWVALFGLYYLVPFTKYSERDALIRLLLGLVLFVILFIWQLRQVLRADLPDIRAVRALAVLLPLFLVVFSAVYLTSSGASSASFNEPLHHTSALYFTITVFSSVGFGDITPRNSTTQLLVSAQMLLDLVIIASVARILIYAAKTGISRNSNDAVAQGEQPLGG